MYPAHAVPRTWHTLNNGALVRIPKRLHLLLSVEREMTRAKALHGKIHSLHEGYGVALEELDELWAEIKRKEAARDPAKLREEALQCAAVLIRMCEELI